MGEKMTPCAECGMPCEAGEYHPYAACLMFKGCHNSTTVRANLTQPAQAVDDDTLLDIARRVGLRQQFTGVNAEDAKFLLRAFVDALPNANGKEG